MNREEQAKMMLQEIVKDIKKKLPKDFGFVMLAFEFDKNDENKMLYVSNSNREDIKLAMEEFIQKTEGQFGKEVL